MNRRLPSVDRVLRVLLDGAEEPSPYPRVVMRDQVRLALDRHRQNGSSQDLTAFDVAAEVRAMLRQLDTPSLRRVINATGVILHTNLGRAPLHAFDHIAGWSNLELDLSTGKRGRRDAHTAPLLEALLHRPSIVVNNNAAAVVLVLSELAPGGEVIVSRGELIEIGEGFRIPDIIARSGAVIREVGTTNRTRLEDYRAAIGAQTRLIMRVHPSNFHVTGFAGRPALGELCQLGQECGIPVYEDLGSGCLVDLRAAGVAEPLVRDSLAAGVDLVSFSCDKLLGGPQSGIIAGEETLVARVRRNPLYRAFRVDKLVIEALEHTLRALLFERWDLLPAIAQILAQPEEIETRARALASMLRDEALRDGALGDGVMVEQGQSPIGGGSTPDQILPTWLVKLTVDRPDEFLGHLRKATVPIIGRIARDQVVLDMRTVAASDLPEVARSVQAAWSASVGSMAAARRAGMGEIDRLVTNSKTGVAK